MSDTGAPPRILLVIAAVLVTATAATVVVLSLALAGPGSQRADDRSANDTPDAPGPLPLVSIPAPEADTPACAALLDALPRSLESSGKHLSRRELAEPAPRAAAAWGQDNPIVLRCGLNTPPELTPTATLRQVNGVQWLPVSDVGSSTWYVVDREVAVALTVPDTAGTGPLQTLSDVVADALPAVPISFE